jgi:3-oxoacyl-ACP reductase-like protein
VIKTACKQIFGGACPLLLSIRPTAASEMSKYALVTGANRGIGLEVVKQLVSHGKPVLLACRDVQKGEQYDYWHHCDERIQTSIQ